MALESIALDFYDRNCIGCTKRVPVRLPNLSHIEPLSVEPQDSYQLPSFSFLKPQVAGHSA
jgi:hypothetical protein